MAIGANDMRAANGKILKHVTCTSCPMPFIAGVDIFAQNLSKEMNL